LKTPSAMRKRRQKNRRHAICGWVLWKFLSFWSSLVVFGGGKLAGVGKALGQSIREFKKEVGSDKKDEEKAEGGKEE